MRGDFARVVGVVDDTAGADLSGARVTVESMSSSTTVDLEDGRFAVERVPLGLVRIVVERSGERHGHTVVRRRLSTALRHPTP